MNQLDPGLIAARHRLRRVASVAALLIFATSCSSDAPTVLADESQARPADDSSAAAVASASDRAIGAGRPLPNSEVPLEPGTWISRLGAPYPDIVLELSDGWSGGPVWISNGAEYPELVGLTVWVVSEVYEHPCQWNQPRITPGPTAEDLAAVLAARPLREASEPQDVEIGGFRGKYLEWSVPDDIDFATCDTDAGEHYFESWRGIAGGSDRYQQGPGQVDELWIIEVGEHRIVFDLTYGPDAADSDAVEELRSVVDNVRFVGVDEAS